MKKFMRMVRSRAWWGVVARVVAGVLVRTVLREVLCYAVSLISM
ncbi:MULTISPECIES: hypothetical protein [Streptomyces griseus group]|nr:hypothetical protein [Streptomyces microflavus]